MGCALQVPGFTHPVTDMYLEDVLRLIGYQDALVAQQHGDPARRGLLDKQYMAPSKADADIPKEQRDAIESAIMQAFLHGTDEHFDFLLEVGQILDSSTSVILKFLSQRAGSNFLLHPDPSDDT